MPTSSSETTLRVRAGRERAAALHQVAGQALQFAHAKAEQLVIDSERRHTETALALQKATEKLSRY